MNAGIAIQNINLPNQMKQVLKQYLVVKNVLVKNIENILVLAKKEAQSVCIVIEVCEECLLVLWNCLRLKSRVCV